MHCFEMALQGIVIIGIKEDFGEAALKCLYLLAESHKDAYFPISLESIKIMI